MSLIFNLQIIGLDLIGYKFPLICCIKKPDRVKILIQIYVPHVKQFLFRKIVGVTELKRLQIIYNDIVLSYVFIPEGNRLIDQRASVFLPPILQILHRAQEEQEQKDRCGDIAILPAHKAGQSKRQKQTE